MSCVVFSPSFHCIENRYSLLLTVIALKRHEQPCASLYATHCTINEIYTFKCDQLGKCDWFKTVLAISSQMNLGIQSN